jgi:hypothetical protein
MRNMEPNPGSYSKQFCPKENHNYTYNSNYPRNRHSQKAPKVYHTIAIKHSKKGLNVYQTHCDFLQDPESFCFAKGLFTKEEKCRKRNSNPEFKLPVNRTQSRSLQITMLLNGV